MIRLYSLTEADDKTRRVYVSAVMVVLDGGRRERESKQIAREWKR